MTLLYHGCKYFMQIEFLVADELNLYNLNSDKVFRNTQYDIASSMLTIQLPYYPNYKMQVIKKPKLSICPFLHEFDCTSWRRIDVIYGIIIFR